MSRLASIFMITVFIGALLLSPSNNAGAMTHDWSLRFGDASYENTYSIAVTPSGNIVVAGYFQDTIDLGGGTLTSAGGYDIFVAKFDPSGAHIWSSSFGDASSQIAYAVAVDDYENVVVTGYFWGTVNFGGSNLISSGIEDIFLVKFDASGVHQWSQSFGDGNHEYAVDVSVDDNGNIVITGDFEGSVSFGGGVLTSTGNSDIYIAVFDSAGNHQWSQRFGDADYQYGASATFDGQGYIVATGYYNGVVNFGGGSLASAGLEDIYLVKFKSNGSHVWSDNFGDSSGQVGFSVTTDTGGIIVLAGYFAGGVDFGGGTLTSAGGDDVFLATFDGNGNYIWSDRYGDAGASQYGYCVEVDGLGNILLTGRFQGSIDFGGGSLTSAGGNDIYVAKFTGTGTHIWSEGFGDALSQHGNSVGVDGTGNVILAGYFQGSVDLGGGTLTSAGQYDVFLAKFGDPEPVITAIEDIPNDQGRRVRISWSASAFDYAGCSKAITDYAIYRRIDYDLDTAPALMSLAGTKAIYAYPPGDWDFIKTVPALGESEYFTVAETLADSTIAEGMYYSTFIVMALTAAPTVHYESAPDSGYSLDNLAPEVPGGFAVAYNTGGGNHLSWEQSPDEDFQYFVVYRGSDPGFAPDESNRVHMTVGVEWYDPEFDGWEVYYKVSAVDFSGNESGPASAGTATAVTGGAAPRTHKLYQNVPNPFNPRTSISFDLAEETAIKLAIYDPAGRLVRTLVSGTLDAKQHKIEWDGTNQQGRPVASGVYIYRLTAGNNVMARKMLLMK